MWNQVGHVGGLSVELSDECRIERRSKREANDFWEEMFCGRLHKKIMHSADVFIRPNGRLYSTSGNAFYPRPLSGEEEAILIETVLNHPEYRGAVGWFLRQYGGQELRRSEQAARWRALALVEGVDFDL